ncbi:unnamed protein product, partial [Gongylonema pulchrum]
MDRETITPNGTIILVLTAEPEIIITIRINVLDINDNSPTFPSKYLVSLLLAVHIKHIHRFTFHNRFTLVSHLQHTMVYNVRSKFKNVSIVESAVIGSRRRLQSASDPDFAENGTIASYVIEGDENTFALIRSSNSTGGDVLLLELLNKLDRETKDLYILNISAYDGGTPPRYGYCTVYVNVLDANDNAPIFTHSRYDIQLNETVTPGAKLLRVRATDADIGANGHITYRLRTNPFEQFLIDQDTGIITV